MTKAGIVFNVCVCEEDMHTVRIQMLNISFSTAWNFKVVKSW